MTVANMRVRSERQGVFIEELATGNKTGKQLRMRIEARGCNRGRKAFYDTVRRLKDFGLITARRIPRDPDEYRGAQAVYELTELGWDEVHAWRQYLEDKERKERERLEWYRQWRLALQEQDSIGCFV